MQSNINSKDLKEVITIAENELTKIKNENSKYYKKLLAEIEKGYNLMEGNSTQKELNKQEKIIWNLINKKNNKQLFIFIILIFIFSTILIFTGYQAYSFIDVIINGDHSTNPPGIPDKDDGLKPETNPNLVNLINVNYNETNIVDLKNLNTVPDSEGLKNPSQSFTISNEYKGTDNLKYNIKYAINIVELSKNKDSVLAKKFIKYRLTYTDESGNIIEEPISSFDKLEKNSDGSYLLFLGTQKKNAQTDFKLTIWLSSLADNSAQGKDYMFMFKVNAVIY